MKKLFLILFIAGCTSTKKTFVIDSRASYITGGDGKGYFTNWVWKKDGKVVSVKPHDIIKTNGKGKYIFTITDNLGQKDSVTINR